MSKFLFFLASFVLSAVGFAALGTTKSFSLKVDDSDLDRGDTVPRQSYSTILEKSTPAVVSVTTQQVVKRMYPTIEDFLRRYYGLPVVNEPNVKEENVPVGIGSGVIVTPEGHTITNAHVITDPRTGSLVEEVLVQLSDKVEYKAQIVGVDRSTDVAVLKIESEKPLPFVTLGNSDLLKVGDIVFAAGNPLGIGKTVTMGIVSATGRSELKVLDEQGSYENFIQTDASINRGNSGGALIDAKGRLVGINTAIISQTGGSVGIGLAIPVKIVKKVLTDFVQGGELRRGFLGVSLNMEDTASGGALVEDVILGSAAEKAGFEPGDLIVSVGNAEVSSANQLRLAIAQTSPGTRIPVVVLRNEVKKTLFVTLELFGGEKKSPIPGVSLESLNTENREKYGIPTQTRGVVVRKSSGAAETFKEGVVIVEINGYQVNSIQEIASELKKGINRFYVWYRGKYRFLAYRVP
mgnify:FL=1